MDQLKWWAENLESNLSQGDIVSAFPIGTLTHPVKYLKKGTFPKGQTGWLELNDPHLDGNSRTHYLAQGKILHGLVVSHSCDIDKNKSCVLIAPLGKLDNLPEAHRQTVLSQTNIALLGMPNIPDFGDGYADLRNITVVPTDVIKSLNRSASMSKNALDLLQARLVTFFTRLELPKL